MTISDIHSTMTNSAITLFVNTRPADRAQPLTAVLRQNGYQVVELPLLELQACPYSSTLDILFQRLPEVQCIVVVSPTAVSIGMQYLQQSGVLLAQLQHIQWIAVGKTTADCLAEYGIDALIPEVETSEGMLSLPLFSEQNDLNKIAFWRGEGGRQFMMQQCLDRQIEVINFVLYQRALPEQSWHVFQQLDVCFSHLSPNLKKWVCISSEASWNNWKLLCQHAPDVLNQMHYLVLGQRLSEILQLDRKQQQFCFKIIQIECLNPTHIVQTLAEYERKS